MRTCDPWKAQSVPFVSHGTITFQRLELIDVIIVHMLTNVAVTHDRNM